MPESNFVTVTTSADDPIHSDLQRVDAHVIQPEEYEEIPEITSADLVHAEIRRPGRPDQPVLEDPSLAP
jgi:precorrin-6B methylase 1